MLCEHLKELHGYIRENEIEIGGLDMIRLVCKKCQVQHECPEVSVEYWDEMPKKDVEKPKSA
ncbi:hypothetical protein GWO43_01860 [candidate division KSB1 bacterium]|nr:hypothetical protein [candidate division KSB1 bacterium]NIR69470.1 hypothetical protein [candidate division KSB1 bacterium]NIS22820.1 hypothetical protein [candidate division KSB1 bacterium]NIT69660.1 hypothetical protein [candidate division KSB1 bacterium]NIU23329.1 hypothetical protein [candidate division KSB1 bacterium]